MADLEKERQRLEHAVQELFGATDEEAKQKDVQHAIQATARIIQKFRFDKREREEARVRTKILKQVGIAVIEPKKI